MKLNSRISTIVFIGLFFELYSSISLAQVPVLKDTPTRSFKILGQLKQAECKKDASDTQAKLEQKVMNLFSKLAGTGAGFKDANAVINFSCAQRKGGLVSYSEELQKAIQCNEGIHCEGDVIRWQ